MEDGEELLLCVEELAGEGKHEERDCSHCTGPGSGLQGEDPGRQEPRWREYTPEKPDGQSRYAGGPSCWRARVPGPADPGRGNCRTPKKMSVWAHVGPGGAPAWGEAIRLMPPQLEITKRDFKLANSRAVSWNMKSEGNRSAFLLTAWMRARGSTS
jgi:hypothetical protein